MANWWLLNDPDNGADLCSADPGFDVDLFVRTDLETMTAIWMGLDSVSKVEDRGRPMRIGDNGIGGAMQPRLGLSPFASYDKRSS